MDLFFDVFSLFKNDYWLWRIVRYSDQEITIKIFSDEDLIVIVKTDADQREYAYLLAAKNLVEWLQRNFDHAKSSTRRGDSKWTEKLKEQLGIVDEIDNADT